MDLIEKARALFQAAPWLIESENGIHIPISGMKPEAQLTWAEFHKIIQAAADLSRLRGEVEEAKRELNFAKNGKGGWDAFELARKDLGEIIGDDYEGRSMWPRLARVRIWWNQMEAERDEARSQLAQARNKGLEDAAKCAEDYCPVGLMKHEGTKKGIAKSIRSLSSTPGERDGTTTGDTLGSQPTGDQRSEIAEATIAAHLSGYRQGYHDGLMQAVDVIDAQDGMQGWKRRIVIALKALAKAAPFQHPDMQASVPCAAGAVAQDKPSAINRAFALQWDDFSEPGVKWSYPRAELLFGNIVVGEYSEWKRESLDRENIDKSKPIHAWIVQASFIGGKYNRAPDGWFATAQEARTFVEEEVTKMLRSAVLGADHSITAEK